MESKIYVIFADSIDDACTFAGYVQSEEAAEKMCDELNSERPDYLPSYEYFELDCLEHE